MKLENLKIGDRLLVGVGSRGRQVAVVASPSRDGLSIRVHKWLARGARWTRRVTVYQIDVFGFATPEDFRKYRVRTDPPRL